MFEKKKRTRPIVFQLNLKMDHADLYDQFGNYMGPELESDEEEDRSPENFYRQELNNADQNSDMVTEKRQT